MSIGMPSADRRKNSTKEMEQLFELIIVTNSIQRQLHNQTAMLKELVMGLRLLAHREPRLKREDSAFEDLP